MAGSDERVPVADLHTPEELLATAEAFLVSDDPQVRRAVVLEAITALEAFVHRTIFGLLNRMMDPLLVKWLDDKTRMDFDSRLSVLTPVALGQPVDKSSDLWAAYRKAKEIRNKVTHSGKRVSRDEAASILETVRKWLAYLGSTAEVTLALDDLKRFVESTKVQVSNEAVAVRLVHDYFSRTQAAVSLEASVGQRARADLVLQFGQHSVVVEVKMVRPGRQDMESRINQATWQVADYIRASNFTRGAVVIFAREALPEIYRSVRVVQESIISVAVIEVSM